MMDYRAKAISRIESLPPVSNSTLSIITMISEENYATQELVQLIEMDLTLAGRCLQMVNSPIYGLKNKVTTVRRAVVLLGVFFAGVLVGWVGRRFPKA